MTVNPAIGVVDVGAPQNIGWAVCSDEGERTGDNLDEFVEVFSHATEHPPALLGFEAPLFIPYGRALQSVTGQRTGENG